MHTRILTIALFAVHSFRQKGYHLASCFSTHHGSKGNPFLYDPPQCLPEAKTLLFCPGLTSDHISQPPSILVGRH